MQRQILVLVVIMMALLSACVAPRPAALGEQAASSQDAGVQPVSAQDEHTHSMPHEFGTEFGEVDFPISCTAEAQAEFNHGMALLHSFWFAPAIQSFNTVAALDPTCGMAQWGVAMSLLGNPFTWPLAGQALVDGWNAVETAAAVGVQTPREQAYVDAIAAFYKDSDTVDHRTRALAYIAAMEQLAQDYADDTEAQIFYALALNATALPTDKSYSNQLKAAQILEAIFVEQPNHPGVAHYLIHSNDVPALAQHGLDAALRYAEIAPAAPHAQHMPSHIFTRLGYWQESIETNRVSAEAARDELSASHEQGAGSYNALHAMDYLMYAHLQLAQDGAAQALLDEINAIEQLDVENFVAAYALAAMPARYALERGDWAAAAALKLHPQNLAWDRFPQAEAVLVFARGLGAARSGDVEAARTDLDRLQLLREAMVATNQAYWAGQADIQSKEIEAWIALAEGENDSALAFMREAATLEDATEKHPVTPGPFVPAHELLGEMLLILEQPAEALVEFEASQQLEPNRFRGLYGAARAADAAGEVEKARAYYTELVALGASTDSERPELATAKAFLAPQVPEALMVSPAEQLAVSMSAEGVQIYQCKPNKDDTTKFEWSFVAPEAVLYDSEHNELATHYAGPTWEANDGSKVVAEVKARADAPSADAIPWLLLTATSTEGTGTFSAVTSIQRVETTGGQAPQDGCDQTHQDEEARVPYTAVYAFYTAQ
jgi:tetratricopeptide (TPR) repeat protein